MNVFCESNPTKIWNLLLSCLSACVSKNLLNMKRIIPFLVFLLASAAELPAFLIHVALPTTALQSGGTLRWKNQPSRPLRLFR